MKNKPVSRLSSRDKFPHRWLFCFKTSSESVRFADWWELEGATSWDAYKANVKLDTKTKVKK